MLRNDSRRHRQLMHLRHHRSLAKAQLYVADHFCDKSDRHLCFNSLEKPTQTNVTSVYKDVNIKIDLEGNGYEKLNSSFNSEPKCHNSHTGPHTGSSARQSTVSDSSTKPCTTSSTQTQPLTPTSESVILWGNSNNHKSGDVV